MGKKLVNKVLLIGWDAADWKVINPLIQQGKMPALKRLMEGGVHGRIKTLDPPLSPMLWTSIATGVRADKHGIKGFVEPTPDGQGLRPVTSTSRKVKAIWNILNQENYKSNVVAWWPSNPAEPINGVMVSNLYQGANIKLEKDWGIPKGTVHPNEMTDTMKALRVHPQELTASMLLPFMPNLAKDKELKDEKRAFGVAKTLAHATTVHAASTYLLRETDWDFMAVYHDAIDHFSHMTMKFHPPKQDHVDQRDYDNYKGVVEAGYQFHDMMLERTLDLIDEDTTVILISDHGFHSDHLRPRTIPQEPSGPAIEHNPYGIIVMNGPGIRKGEEISGASVIDITPTLLTLYGLPVGKDMEGKVLTACFDEPIEPEFIDSWEKVDGNDGMHDADLKEDPWAAQEAMQQLVELGYIDAIDDNKLEAVEKAKAESEYYVARNLINGGRVHEGAGVLERIFAETRIDRYGKRLASCFLQLGEYSKCETLINELKVVEKENAEARKKARLEKNPDDPFGDQGMEEPMYLEYVEGLLYLAKNNINRALPILENVQEKNKANIGVCLNIGKIHLNRKNYVSASEQYIKALAIDEYNVVAHHGLGVSFLRRSMFEEAVDEFLSALELNFYHVHSHYHLGEAYAQLKQYDHAVEAFSMAVRLAPGMTKAHQWLSELYNNQLNRPDLAREHDLFIQKNIVAEMTIVTGLLRSGTSMVLNMLKAGGLEIYQSPAISGGIEDVENENSNFKLDKNWLHVAEGTCVKIKAGLLNYLPVKYQYKVIIVDRDLEQVVESQQRFKGKKIREGALPIPLFNELQSQTEKIQLWIDTQPKAEILRLNFDDILENPEKAAQKIAEFLNVPLDTNKMASTISKKEVSNS